MHYGSALTTQGDPKLAMKLLQPHLRRHPYDTRLYATYAQAAQRAGDRAATHATLAEYYYLNGELLAAVDQLEAGLRNPGLSPNQEAQLRARLKKFRAEALAQDLPISKSTTP
jgi:predicted Zn-dependent protease